MPNLLWKRDLHCSASLPPSCSLRVSLNVHLDISSHSGSVLFIYITINIWEFWSSPLVPLAGLALTSASHVQFADWPLRAGYLFMIQCCQPIHMWCSLEVPMLPAVLGYQLLVSAKMAHKIPIRGRQVVKFLVWSLEESENKSPIVRLEYKKNKKPHCTFFCSDMTQRKQGSIWGLYFLDSCSHIV